MKKRQRITLDSILEVEINNGEYFVYAQILNEADYAFFDYKSDEKLTDLKILNGKEILFIVAVYDDVVTKGHWMKVGKLPLRNELKIKPMKFIQDAQNPEVFEFYNPNTGEITPAIKADCKGLECATVWEAIHVEERIQDHYNGKENKWRKMHLEKLK